MSSFVLFFFPLVMIAHQSLSFAVTPRECPTVCLDYVVICIRLTHLKPLPFITYHSGGGRACIPICSTYVYLHDTKLILTRNKYFAVYRVARSNISVPVTRGSHGPINLYQNVPRRPRAKPLILDKAPALFRPYIGLGRSQQVGSDP